MIYRHVVTVLGILGVMFGCKTVSQNSGVKELPGQNYCQSLGFVTRPFLQAEPSATLGSIATDFTIPTRTGSFNFSEAFTGCDNYLIVQDLPRQHVDHKTSPWLDKAASLLKRLPRNTHVIFVSIAKDPALRDASLNVINENLEDALTTLSVNEQDFWRKHLHLATIPAAELPSWLGTLMQSPGWGVGIDRFQRIRFVGSYSDPHRFNAKLDDFGPNLMMLANEPIYYNFEEARERQLAAYPATIVPIFDNKTKPKEETYAYTEVSLPSKAELARFDTLEIDLHAKCPGDGELGDCPAWDEAIVLYLCDREKPDQCDTEIARWISTYHRVGRWVHDMTPFLPLVRDGGKLRFALRYGQPYAMDLKFRFSNQKKSLNPTQTVMLFKEGFGANFDQNYNTKRQPKKVFIPKGAKKVELVSLITGHGMQEPGNCAEFCDTTHRFYVNGKSFERSFPETQNDMNCMDEVKHGTVPNQYGTWWYGRSGWCPGKEVPLHRQDITDLVTLEQDNEFHYEGFYQGKVYPGHGAGFLLSSAVVIYM